MANRSKVRQGTMKECHRGVHCNRQKKDCADTESSGLLWGRPGREADRGRGGFHEAGGGEGAGRHWETGHTGPFT